MAKTDIHSICLYIIFSFNLQNEKKRGNNQIKVQCFAFNTLEGRLFLGNEGGGCRIVRRLFFVVRDRPHFVYMILCINI